MSHCQTHQQDYIISTHLINDNNKSGPQSCSTF